VTDTPYQVLARKYRPGHFRDLIGQEAMVRTLTNAFAHDRIAHAFIMTGVRGVGKTTTARIIAKGLNCQSAGRPTIDPCGTCEACVSIGAGRNVDVIEMDAASNTQVDKIRAEIIDTIAYAPTNCRYKVFIVDEVHMLSTSSFNALLKTLEEPPAHVKFIFATTEIRKVPVTVLSRCQRFDLRRIEPEVMIAHLSAIAGHEGAALTEEALALITRAAEGSVRDALSLLDQAIAHGRDTEIGAEAVRTMLGLADRGRVIDLFEAIMRGDTKAALEDLARQYADGADPAAVLRDLAELTHWISVLKVAPETGDDPTVSQAERDRGRDLAGRLPMRVLTRAWQMLLKTLDEVPLSPNAMMAAEMAVIRLTHVADLPPPEELVRKLTEEAAGAQGGAQGPAPRPNGGGGVGGGKASSQPSGPTALAALPGGRAGPGRAPAPTPDPAPDAGTRLAAWPDFPAALAAVKRLDFKLFDDAETFLRLVRYRPGLIEFTPAPGAPQDLAGRLAQMLRTATGERWAVTVSNDAGQPSIAEARRAAEDAARRAARDHPLVARALAIFPGAEVTEVRPLAAPAAPDYLPAIPDPEDETPDDDADLLDTDDPFHDDGT